MKHLYGFFPLRASDNSPTLGSWFIQVVMNILYDVILGFWMAQLTQVNHVNEEVPYASSKSLHDMLSLWDFIL